MSAVSQTWISCDAASARIRPSNEAVALASGDSSVIGRSTRRREG
jgi:hypothetical protein